MSATTTLSRRAVMSRAAGLLPVAAVVAASLPALAKEPDPVIVLADQWLTLDSSYSGLTEAEVEERCAQPRVSQIRISSSKGL